MIRDGCGRKWCWRIIAFICIYWGNARTISVEIGYNRTNFGSVHTFVGCKSAALPLYKLWACGPTLSSTNYLTGLHIGQQKIQHLKQDKSEAILWNIFWQMKHIILTYLINSKYIILYRKVYCKDCNVFAIH